MRPARLEVSGFTAFRDRVEIDFEGADLFALVGPTGSGKSSVIDAICFALYGSIPRYDDRRLVEPAISQGGVEARVLFEFSVGEERYVAARVVRRTAKGASTAEARLERVAGGEVLAGDAKGVTAGVASLLGLSFEHFTRCVVLPQGEFARFLHDNPGSRQDLLVSLLDLGLYERMAALARQRAADAGNRVELIGTQLEKLGHATPEARQATAERVGALDALKERLEKAGDGLDALADEVAAAASESRQAGERIRLLGDVAVPEGVPALASDVASAVAEQAAASAADDEAEQAATAADEALSRLPAEAELTRVVSAREELARQESRAVTGRAQLIDVRTQVAEASGELERARADRAAAATALDQVRLAHRAHEVAEGLEVGRPCPVCGAEVEALPERGLVAGLDEAAARLELADRTVEAARAALQTAEVRRTKVEVTLAEVEADIERLGGELADALAQDEVERARARRAEAQEAAATARRARQQARARKTAADKVLAALRERETEARRAFDAARDRLAALTPPAAQRDDLAEDWCALSQWAADRMASERAAAGAADARVATARDRQSQLVDELVEACAGAGLSVSAEPLERAAERLWAACTEAAAAARADHARVERELAEAEVLRAQAQQLVEVEAVAATLGRHLGARGFEKWVLDEALGMLVAGATGLLHELSGGQFSLGLDERTSNFMVVDHRNADELRPARTLSGGETFLASLALALALADQLADLASQGSARLESIFLDEGFGTLDPDTLDAVACAIEELGSRGRMVGLVSHVRELADRVPVRFEVRKGPLASTIERIDA